METTEIAPETLEQEAARIIGYVRCRRRQQLRQRVREVHKARYVASLVERDQREREWYQENIYLLDLGQMAIHMRALEDLDARRFLNLIRKLFPPEKKRGRRRGQA